ncbi:hypothetical protein RhiirC2_797860 [Rhizophagus irregularis]|uniref:Uncharacterized protein n=1 Tax=Rhizophagus irregularis TaxID=588596 RepID=A0A2N1M7C9_9GLOM|nr:hypothetical protein RhiirC2_797860 [Rhizophagus irregularis]
MNITPKFKNSLRSKGLPKSSYLPYSSLPSLIHVNLHDSGTDWLKNSMQYGLSWFNHISEEKPYYLICFGDNLQYQVVSAQLPFDTSVELHKIKFLKIKKIFSGECSVLATIFFDPNSSGSNLASLLRTRQTPYWKNYNSANISEWQENLISYELNILEKRVKKINTIETGIATERTFSEIEKTICYISVAKICTGQKTEGFEKVLQLRETHLVRNQKNSNNFYEPFAILENRSQLHEA